jgi:hypothetical protein
LYQIAPAKASGFLKKFGQAPLEPGARAFVHKEFTCILPVSTV